MCRSRHERAGAAAQRDPGWRPAPSSSAPAPATRCATGAPSAMPRWPTTPRGCTACGCCCVARPATIEREMGAAIMRHARTRDQQSHRRGHPAAAAGAAVARDRAAEPGFGSGAHGHHGGHAGHRPVCGHQSRPHRPVPVPRLVRGRLPPGRRALSRAHRRRSCPGPRRSRCRASWT